MTEPAHVEVSSADPRAVRLRIVAVNDVYVLDHLPSLATLVHEARTVDPVDRLLVTLAGDFVAPSVLSSLDAGRGMVDCMNALGVTHVVLGNHEDDLETPQLSERIRELHATCLGTNVRGFDPQLPEYDVVEIVSRGLPSRTIRLGIVGVVLDDRAVYRRPPFGGAGLFPANDAALREATRLVESRACDAVLAMTHQALVDDRALARRANDPPFVAIVGGHEHQGFLENVNSTWIVKAPADAVRAVVLDVVFREGADSLRPEVSARFVDVDAYPKDPALVERVARHMAQVRELSSATLLVMREGCQLSSVGTRARQTTMGTLLASRVRDALGADACVFNGGGIRGSRTYTERFSYGDLQAEVPFENEIVVVALPGRVLSDAVKASRSRAPVESGGFFQVCDALRVDPVTHEVTHLAGEPLEPTREVRVALVRNLFAGMDHVMPLVDFASAHPSRIPAAGSGRDVKLVLLESFAKGLFREIGGFEVVDEDHDGQVTPSELERAITGYTGDGPSHVAAGIVMRTLDTDHDDRISRVEAEAAELPKRGS